MGERVLQPPVRTMSVCVGFLPVTVCYNVAADTHTMCLVTTANLFVSTVYSFYLWSGFYRRIQMYLCTEIQTSGQSRTEQTQEDFSVGVAVPSCHWTPAPS